MSTISGISSSMNMAGGALKTHATGLQVTAHNVANVSTDNFIPRRSFYTTGPGGNGVDLQSVLQETDAAGQLKNSGDTRATATNLPSGTELAKEMPSMILTQRGFEANAKTIRTADEMLGTLLDIVS